MFREKKHRSNSSPKPSPRFACFEKIIPRPSYVRIDGAPPIFSHASLPALVPHFGREFPRSSSRARHSAGSFHTFRPFIGIERCCCNLAASTNRCGRHDQLGPPRGMLCAAAYKSGLWLCVILLCMCQVLQKSSKMRHCCSFGHLSSNNSSQSFPVYLNYVAHPANSKVDPWPVLAPVPVPVPVHLPL